VTIDHGAWDIQETSSTDTGHGGVEATDDNVVFHWDASTFTFDVVRDPDGTLHLTPIEGLEPGDVFVWTTEPWTPIGTVLAGTYSWTLTADDAPLDPNYGGSDQLDTYPWTFTISLAADGTCSGFHTESGVRHDDGTCTYDATRDRLDLHWGPQHYALGYTVDGDGNLHTTPIQPIEGGDAYVTTTKPWLRQ
jgi:hypothetical protein